MVMSSSVVVPYTITFVGVGYVGLPWAALFASWGHKVFALDVDEEKINVIKQGRAHFSEPGLDELVSQAISSGNLIPTTDYSEAIPTSSIVFICVGTPSNDQGEADLGYVFSAIDKIARNLGDQFTVIVNRSTVPPGTMRKVSSYLEEVVGDSSRFAVVSSPEFLRQGHAITDTLKPSRVIIGSDNEQAIVMMKQLHEPLDCPKLIMSPESAELVKYGANTYLAARIVFADQLSNLAESIGADITQVLQGIGLDPRIGEHFWYPGLGYGGYCFPKDVKALASVYEDRTGDNDNLFHYLDRLNDRRIRQITRLIKSELGHLAGKKIAVWGLSAKPQSPDMRGSTPVLLIQALAHEGAIIHAYDPFAREEAERTLKGIIAFHDQPHTSVEEAFALLILTEHAEFKEFDYSQIRNSMSGNFLLDAKRVLSPHTMKSHGFNYFGTGWGSKV